jgi:hypothetical protein
VLDIAEFVKTHCRVDGHYFNAIRGEAKDASLKELPSERLAGSTVRFRNTTGTTRARWSAVIEG